MAMMQSGQKRRFDRRFYRGLASALSESASGYHEGPCITCGTWVHLVADDETPRCFACSNARNPYAEKGIRCSVEAEGEDARDPRRVADGTAGFNLGLRGVDTVVGTRPDGTPKLAYRPITHNELSTARARREYARRTGCTVLTPSVKRAVGGR